MRLRLICIVAMVVFAAGCVSRTPAPVIDKSRQSTYAYQINENVCQAETADEFCHVVKKGDTLYGISRRHGLKVVEIASRNNISSPFIIRPGDLLVVRRGGARPTGEPSVVQAVSVPEPQPRPVERAQPAVREPAREPVVATPTPQPEPTPSQPKTTQPKPAPATALAVPAAPAPKMTVRKTRTKSGWQWPTRYEPLASSNKTGLDYLLADGTEIVAAFGGKVIYAGAGLNKYRHLVIVDTGSRYLVAYEFNTSHAIQEGQRIKRGGVIARISPTGAATASIPNRHQQFHFEIWAGGKPQNPNSVIALASRN